MSEDQFIKLLKYLEAFKLEVHNQFEEAKVDRADIRGAIAELSAKAWGLS